MKCDEAQLLQGPYLDSELDARTTLHVEEHLKSCPKCARLFAEGRGLETTLNAALNQGPRNEALWAEIEHTVVTSALSGSQPARAVAQPAAEHTAWGMLGQQLRAAWRRSRWAWAGLGAAWVVILVLNGSAQEPDTRVAAGQGVPSLSEMRFAWQQKQLLMAELAATSDPAPVNKPTAAPPRPRSQRASETPNA
jgi:anti-sigma factor RsiW